VWCLPQDLDKTTIGSYLGEREDFNIKVTLPLLRGGRSIVERTICWLIFG